MHWVYDNNAGLVYTKKDVCSIEKYILFLK